MDQLKLIELQQQMKTNQAQLGDYLKDLDSWTDEIKKKEETLKEQKPDGDTVLPPVRNSLDKKKRKKKKKKKTEETDAQASKKNLKIRSYDYQSWDKFDVDKALEDVDGEKLSESEYETDEEWEIERTKQQAVIIKDQGNQHFKDGNFTEAIECYTQGISCDPENAVLPANRAMALLKQEKYGAAELDCSQALHLDPGYTKAYHRRGTARAALGRYADAKIDFLAVLERDAKNMQAKAELDKVEKILNPPEILKSLSLETDGAGIVSPVYKPPAKRSKKPLRRMEIEEIGIVEREIKIPQASDRKMKVEAHEKASFDRQFMKKDTRLEPSSEEDPTSNNLRNKISEITSQVMATSLNETTDEDGVKLDLSQMKTESVKPRRSSSDNSPQTSPRVPPVPSTSYQLQIDMRVLKSRPTDFYQYLKAIPHQQLSALFRSFLDATMLMQILNTLHEYYVPSHEDVYPVLAGLLSVQRFNMTVMLMSKEEKKVISDLVAYAQSRDQASPDKIAALSKKYGV